MRNAFVEALYDIAGKDQRVVTLVGDNGAIVFDRYRESYPERFINCGIAEANMIGVAAGMAACGKIPFTYTIANFLTQRAFEQIRNDICLQKMNVKLVGIGVGFVYSDLGPTHHGTEDIALMRALPGMTIISPADPVEAQKATWTAAELEGPVYLRLATSRTPRIYDDDYEFEFGRGVVLREGGDVTIISTGNILHEVIKAAEQLKREGISIRLVNIHTIKPLDEEIILESAQKTRAVLTVEEHTIAGGLGSAVAEVILEGQNEAIQFQRMGLPGAFAQGYGSYDEMKEMNGLGWQDICSQAKRLYEKKLQLV